MDETGRTTAGGMAADDGRLIRGDTRRAAILEAATREFGRRGYETARIADIARAAGVTDAGLLHHFSTKKELFLAVVALREESYPPLSRIGSVTARAFVDGMIMAIGRAAANPDLVRFRSMLTGTSGMDGHPAAGRSRRNLEAGLATMVPLFQAAVDSGELRPDTDARQVVLELLALNDGIRNQWAAWPTGVDYTETFARAANALYARIASPSD